MLFLVLYLFAVCTCLGTLVWASVTDYRFLRIPNAVSILAICGFGLVFAMDYFGAKDFEIFSSLSVHLISAAIVFVFTAILFALKVFGAGDAKMASAFALWVPLADLPTYLIMMTFAGGVLGLASLMFQKVPLKTHLGSKWIETLQKGGSAVPYGIAISIAVLFIFIEGDYLSAHVLKSFIE